MLLVRANLVSDGSNWGLTDVGSRDEDSLAIHPGFGFANTNGRPVPQAETDARDQQQQGDCRQHPEVCGQPRTPCPDEAKVKCGIEAQVVQIGYNKEPESLHPLEQLVHGRQHHLAP